MKASDRRALLILGLWLGGVGLYLAGRKLVAFRRAWAETRTGLQRAGYLQGQLDHERRALAEELARLKGTFPKDLQALGEDELRLKGQAALLGAAERAGLQGLRLRGEPQGDGATWKELRWTLEGEGTLAQWVSAFQGMEKALPMMRIQAFRLEGGGDPWASQAPPEGPPIKGGVVCSWLLSMDPGAPASSVQPLSAFPAPRPGNP